MNKKNFKRLALIAVMGLTIMACSQSEDTQTISKDIQESTVDGMFHYTMYLNCDAPDDDNSATTRAVTRDWPNNAVLYLRYKNGSSYVAGKATYNRTAGSWNVDVPSSLPTTNSASCEVYYFENVGSESGNSVTLNESTCCFFTTSATYKHPSSSAITVNATLGRKTWRLRFKGTSGTAITLPGSGNEVNYFTAFNYSTGNFTKEKKDVSLSVGTNGYTSYVYGEFSNTTGGKITVTNGNQSYYRTITASNLAIGESGCLTIPTSNSHSGWEVLLPKEDDTVDPNATIQTDYAVTFTDGIVMTWQLGSTVNTFDYHVYTKSDVEALTEEQLANKIYSSPYTLAYADYFFSSTGSQFFTSNTEYYLCAVAKNSSGVRGPVLKHLFKTNSENLPYAEISNVKATSTTKWTYDIALKNNAKSYYLFTSVDEDDYTGDWHWLAFYVHYAATSGQLTPREWSTVATTLSSGTCNLITICTWGIGANNNIGNPNIAYGNVNLVDARPLYSASSTPMKEVLSKERMLRLRDNTVIYRIDQ